MPWNNQVLSTGSMLVIASTLFFSSQTLVYAKDISGCCTTILISSDGESITHQSNRVGEYTLSGVVADRPMYKNIDREEYLFYLMSKNKGLWMVGPKVNQFNGGLAHRGDTLCAEDVAAGDWKYTDGKAWHVDPTLNLTCIDRQSVDVECTYRDGVQFVGGDLPDEYGGGGIATSSDSSAECIQECENREGCKYWSWVERDGANCFLKIDKIQSVRVPKYVSGSIPSACISGPVEEPSLENSCSYQDIQFVGGDISSVSAGSLDGCRSLCAEDPNCQLFTYYPQEVTNCFLKSETAQAKVSTDAISGSVDEDCKDVVLPDINLSFDKNQINGKFKMDMTFREELSDSNSVEYQKLAGSIEGYLRDMLEAEPEFAEQAVFDVRVVSFTPGSVVCNFKVNYVLREAYLAIPFAIKPTNITTAMNKNFKFRRGIIFQKFIIVAGSFKSSAPVDHCSAKGCSHKCNYDYSLESYVCTCPPSLVLDLDQKTCVEPDQVGLADTTTYQPQIEVTLLPSDCLWSSWSEWSTCNCVSSQSDRKRTILTPAKNGGLCSGRYKEVKDCECNGDEPVTTIAPEAIEDSETDAVVEPVSGQDAESTTVIADVDTEETSTDTTIESVTFGDKETTTAGAAIMTTESVLMDESEEETTDNNQEDVEGEATTSSGDQDTDSVPEEGTTVATGEETTVVPEDQTTVIFNETDSETADDEPSYEYDDVTFKPTEAIKEETYDEEEYIDESTTTENEVEIEAESADDASTELVTESEIGSTDSPMEATTELASEDDTTDIVASTEDAQAAGEDDMDSLTTEMSVEKSSDDTELSVEDDSTESIQTELPRDTEDSLTTEQTADSATEMTTESGDMAATEGVIEDIEGDNDVMETTTSGSLEKDLDSEVTEKPTGEETTVSKIDMTTENAVDMEEIEEGEVTTTLDNIYDDDTDSEYDTDKVFKQTTSPTDIEMEITDSTTEDDVAVDIEEITATESNNTSDSDDTTESDSATDIDAVDVTEAEADSVTEADADSVTEADADSVTEADADSVTEANVAADMDADITTESSNVDAMEAVTATESNGATDTTESDNIDETNTDTESDNAVDIDADSTTVSGDAADNDSTTVSGDAADNDADSTTVSGDAADMDAVNTTESDDAADVEADSSTESVETDEDNVDEVTTESESAAADSNSITTESDIAAENEDNFDSMESTAEEDSDSEDTTSLPTDDSTDSDLDSALVTEAATNTDDDSETTTFSDTEQQERTGESENNDNSPTADDVNDEAEDTEISTQKAINDMDELAPTTTAQYDEPSTGTETPEEADERIVFPDSADEETTLGDGLTSLSQTKDQDDNDIVDTTMITDTPRSFPDTSNMNSIDDDSEISTTVGYLNPEGTTSAPSDLEDGPATTIVPMAATVISIEEDETTVTITTVASVEKSADGESTEDVTTTKPSMDEGEHEFDCEELAEGDLNTTSEQIPMKCTQMDGSERRRVFLVISKSQVSADTLFAKNVKVVVKDLMVMSITPEEESSTS